MIAWLRIHTCFWAAFGVASAMATTVVPPAFEVLVNDSDYIIHAVVRRVTVEKRTSAHGGKIVTLVELDLIEAVAGEPPAKVILELLGGRVDDEELIVAGMPRFTEGQEEVLFVSNNGRAVCPLYGMMHGRYAVERLPVTGRNYVVRSDGTPLLDTSQIAAPLGERRLPETIRQVAAMNALTPADFIRHIRAAAAHANRNREK